MAKIKSEHFELGKEMGCWATEVAVHLEKVGYTKFKTFGDLHKLFLGNAIGGRYTPSHFFRRMFSHFEYYPNNELKKEGEKLKSRVEDLNFMEKQFLFQNGIEYTKEMNEFTYGFTAGTMIEPTNEGA